MFLDFPRGGHGRMPPLNTLLHTYTHHTHAHHTHTHHTCPPHIPSTHHETHTPITHIYLPHTPITHTPKWNTYTYIHPPPRTCFGVRSVFLLLKTLLHDFSFHLSFLRVRLRLATKSLFVIRCCNTWLNVFCTHFVSDSHPSGWQSQRKIAVCNWGLTSRVVWLRNARRCWFN